MRRYGILSVATILVISGIGVVALLQGWLVTAAVVGYITFAVTTAVVLLCTRYIARLIRTGERKSRLARMQLSADIDNLKLGQDRGFEQQFRLIKTTHGVIKSTQQSLSESSQELTGLEDQLAKLDTKIQKTARNNTNHVTQSARHATSEIEALLQIYSRFSDMKLPMPSTGGWALDAQSLAYLISIFEEQRPQRILELGSGTSTIWLGYLCRLHGAKLVTLDHLEEYLEKTRASLGRHELDPYVEARFAPLKDYLYDGETMKWYSDRALVDLSDIDMVVVDGPPAATGPKARYPALPNVIDLLATEATVILDDAHRPDEDRIIEQWISEYPEFTRIIIDTPRLAILRRGN